MSPKATAKVKRDARNLVLKRDANHCQRCGRSIVDFQAAQHHRRRKGMGGSALLERASILILVCGHGNTDFCHGEVHGNPDKAHEEGWMLWDTDDPETTPILTIHGWVTLSDDGGRFSLTEGRAV
jgi:hypothetical protein